MAMKTEFDPASADLLVYMAKLAHADRLRWFALQIASLPFLPLGQGRQQQQHRHIQAVPLLPCQLNIEADEDPPLLHYSLCWQRAAKQHSRLLISKPVYFAEDAQLGEHTSFVSSSSSPSSSSSSPSLDPFSAPFSSFFFFFLPSLPSLSLHKQYKLEQPASVHL